MNNHGELGEVLYFKFTVDKFNSHFKEPQDIKDGDCYTVEECDKKFKGLITSVPIHIDNNTQGNYECVYEFGVEVY